MTDKNQNQGCGNYMGYKHTSGARAYCGDDVGTHIIYCSKCKSPQNHSLQKENRLSSRERRDAEDTPSEKVSVTESVKFQSEGTQAQGCGKIYDNIMVDGDRVICGKGFLCPKCNPPQNHSPAPMENQDTPSGTTSQGIQPEKPEGTFNLSNEFRKVRKSDGTHNITDIEKLEEHVKTFIKILNNLKVDLDDNGEGWVNIADINNLAGEELCK